MGQPTRKILLAYGPQVKNEEHWNWCDENEPVWAHGGRCCNSLQCGCSVSFTGLYTGKAASRGIVTEVDWRVCNAVMAKFPDQYLELHPETTAEKLAELIAFVQAMPQHLAKLPAGTIVCIEWLSVDREFQLIPQT